MGQLLSLSDFQPGKRPKSLYFGRGDLMKLLAFYARQVARGLWRDYAIDHLGERAVFSVFSRSYDVPLFQIIKYRTRTGPTRYAVFSRNRQLKASKNLDDILDAIKIALSIV